MSVLCVQTTGTDDQDFKGWRGSSDSSEEEDRGTDSYNEEEDDWKPEYEDWQGESKDFTKKLNAARSGGHQGGSNTQHQRSDSVSTSKSFHVSLMSNPMIIFMGSSQLNSTIDIMPLRMNKFMHSYRPNSG